MSFYIALIAFLVSFSLALLLVATFRRESNNRLVFFALMHLMLLFAFLASLVLRNETTSPNYFFLAYVCSGLILSGLVIRSGMHFFAKAYFSLFILTLPLFLYSPSMLVNFLLTMKYSSAHGPKFPLTGKYYLESQNVIREGQENILYKLVLKRGMYHQTIERDINFGGKLDSVKVLEVNGTYSIKIRGYHSKISFVSTESDSLDTEVSLRKRKYGDVEYRL